jgi:predicted dehydrogenase
MFKQAELDAVAVCTPTFAHTPIARAAIDAGLDVLMEKPIAPTLEETDAFIIHALATDRIVQVGLVYRYSNLYRTLGQMAERGDFGPVMMAWCQEHRDNFPTQWFFETKKSGGAILDKDCHHFDLFSWFINARPVRVVALGGQHVVKGKSVKINCGYAPDPDLMIKNPDIVDHANVIVEYENGAMGNLSLCMYEAEPLEGLKFGVMGTNGAHAQTIKDIVLNAGGGPLGEIEEVPVDYFNDNHGIGHIGCQVQHSEFIKRMDDRQFPYANLLLARESMVISMAAEQAIVDKRSVLISEYDNPGITKLLKRHAKDMARPTPAPLPAPVPRVEKEPTPQEELINTLLMLVKMIFKPKVKGKFKEFDKDLFQKLADKLNKDKKFLDMSRGMSARVAFEGPDDSKAMVEFRDGHAFPVPFKEAHAEVTVKFTKEGWKDLFAGTNVQNLVMSRKIILTGRIAQLRPYTEAMIHVTDVIKKI